jgi:quercetin dioxygenase-like cupin family protein
MVDMAECATAEAADVEVLPFDESCGVRLAAGIMRRHVHGKQGTVAVFEFETGAVVPLHQHPNEQITYILKGAVDVTVDGVKHRVSAGELIVLPPNVPHAFVALEPTTDLDFFSPPRADWERGDEAYLRGDA